MALDDFARLNRQSSTAKTRMARSHKVHVEFFKDPDFESFDCSVTVFLGFFELTNPFLQAGHHKATFSLKKKKLCQTNVIT